MSSILQMIFQIHFLNEYIGISIEMSLKFVPEGPNDNEAALVQVVVWHLTDHIRLMDRKCLDNGILIT